MKFIGFIMMLSALGCSNEQAYEMLHPAHVKVVEEPVTYHEYCIHDVCGYVLEERQSVCENREEYFR
jgi:hypothetical protein